MRISTRSAPDLAIGVQLLQDFPSAVHRRTETEVTPLLLDRSALRTSLRLDSVLCPRMKRRPAIFRCGPHGTQDRRLKLVPLLSAPARRCLSIYQLIIINY